VERSELLPALLRDKHALLKLSDTGMYCVIEAFLELPGEESDMVQLAFAPTNEPCQLVI